MNVKHIEPVKTVKQPSGMEILAKQLTGTQIELELEKANNQQLGQLVTELQIEIELLKGGTI